MLGYQSGYQVHDYIFHIHFSKFKKKKKLDSAIGNSFTQKHINKFKSETVSFKKTIHSNDGYIL